jgi:hypothetical protein
MGGESVGSADHRAPYGSMPSAMTCWAASGLWLVVAGGVSSACVTGQPSPLWPKRPTPPSMPAPRSVERPAEVHWHVWIGDEPESSNDRDIDDAAGEIDVSRYDPDALCGFTETDTVGNARIRHLFCRVGEVRAMTFVARASVMTDPARQKLSLDERIAIAREGDRSGLMMSVAGRPFTLFIECATVPRE